MKGIKADALQVVSQILREYVETNLNYYDPDKLLTSLPGLQELVDRLPPGVDLRQAPAKEEEWREALIGYLAERIVAGWDQYQAPSAARQPDGQFAASFERPGPEFTTTAESKRAAYQAARREWIARILQRSGR